MKKSTFNKIREIISDKFHVEKQDVGPETKLGGDLCFDSLSMMILISAIEHEFDIVIPDEKLDKLYTVGDLVVCVDESKHKNLTSVQKIGQWVKEWYQLRADCKTAYKNTFEKYKSLSRAFSLRSDMYPRASCVHVSYFLNDTQTKFCPNFDPAELDNSARCKNNKCLFYDKNREYFDALDAYVNLARKKHVFWKEKLKKRSK